MRLRQPFAVRFPGLWFSRCSGEGCVLLTAASGDGRVGENGLGEFGSADFRGKEANRDPDFLHEAPKKFASAAFSKESRMEFANANKLDRKSGGRTWKRICLPKWYWAMPPFEETVAP
jgi:hypothetical protein